MIESLTPQGLGLLMFAMVIGSGVLGALLATLAMLGYRRAVEHAMAARGVPGNAPAGGDAPAPPGAAAPGGRNAEALYRRALAGPWRTLGREAGAGAGFATVLAVAAYHVWPHGLGLPGFLIGAWIYAWPLVPAALLVVPASLRMRAGWLLAYFLVLMALTLWAATIPDLPATRVGAFELPARSSANPITSLKLWLVANAVPSVLALACFHRSVRAVAPVVLAISTTAVVGLMAGVLAQFSERGIDATVAMAVAFELSVGWLVLGAALLALAASAAVGFGLARLLARAHRRTAISDQSLLLGALWLLYGVSYGFWLAFGGIGWAAAVPLAFAVYAAVGALTDRLAPRRPGTGPGLTFLRVFALGPRGERLLDSVARHWRHIGPIQMIAGPDVARSTVEPHQFLDYLSGRLGTHFVRDEASYRRSLAGHDRGPARDGRFRVNNCFCDADSWKAVLPRLTAPGDAVLMDLRSFGRDNDGCRHELEHLAANVPVERWVLVVDADTDGDFLEQSLARLLARCPPGAPNHARAVSDVRLQRVESPGGASRALLRALCNAASHTAGSSPLQADESAGQVPNLVG